MADILINLVCLDTAVSSCTFFFLIAVIASVESTFLFTKLILFFFVRQEVIDTSGGWVFSCKLKFSPSSYALSNFPCR